MMTQSDFPEPSGEFYVSFSILWGENELYRGFPLRDQEYCIQLLFSVFEDGKCHYLVNLELRSAECELSGTPSSILRLGNGLSIRNAAVLKALVC